MQSPEPVHSEHSVNAAATVVIEIVNCISLKRVKEGEVLAPNWRGEKVFLSIIIKRKKKEAQTLKSM